MKITICVNKTHNWLPTDFDKGLLNGSEEMVVHLSRALSKLGHYVDVYSSCYGKRILTDVAEDYVVDYADLKYFDSDPHSGVLIAFKNSACLTTPGYDKRFLWTADPTRLTPGQRQCCDFMYGLSPWHERELTGLNIGFRNISYIEPGLDCKKHTEMKSGSSLKERNEIEQSEMKLSSNQKYRNETGQLVNLQCLYASSPDRGLDYLLTIWPKIREAVPEATLKVTYKDMDIPEINGVQFMGRLTNSEMNRLYARSDVLLYPCSGGERYCITAMKAQHMGVIPCVIPTMALVDTIQFGVKSLQTDYLADTVELLTDTNLRLSIRQKMLKELKYHSWEETAIHWEQIVGRKAFNSSGGRKGS